MTVIALLQAVGPGPVDQTRGVRTDVTLARCAVGAGRLRRRGHRQHCRQRRPTAASSEGERS